MIAATDTPDSPWYVIDSNDQKRGRLNCITHLLSLIPYEEVPHPEVVLPARVHNPDYLRDWGKTLLRDTARPKEERQREAEKIWRRLVASRPTDPLVKGETLAGQCSYHVLNTSGPPMIHVTRSFRPEIVLFGQNQRFTTPLVLDADALTVGAAM